MQSLANQAAIAIENARLYESMGRQVAQLTALQETNRAVASTLERDALLKLIMEQATTLLRAGRRPDQPGGLGEARGRGGGVQRRGRPVPGRARPAGHEPVGLGHPPQPARHLEPSRRG